jgi:hypothetical protein
MLHFVQHDKFLINVIPLRFPGFLEMTFAGAEPSLSLRLEAELTGVCHTK